MTCDLASLQQAFATGLVLGAAICFAIGILVGLGWANMKKPKDCSQ